MSSDMKFSRMLYVTPCHLISLKVNSKKLTYLVPMARRVRMACKTTRSVLILPSLGRVPSRFLLELQQLPSINPPIQASCSTHTRQSLTTRFLAQPCGRASLGERSLSFCTRSSTRKVGYGSMGCGTKYIVLKPYLFRNFRQSNILSLL
jgi:hypothetical protein